MLTLPFTRRRVAPPALPARHPRRCRKCGGLVVPDRSRRYGGFARPDLVDAMGFQIKPGSGFQIKPGLGFEYADSSKACCCTTTDCSCTACTTAGYSIPCCITAVLSGLNCCPNDPLPKAAATALNGTYSLIAGTSFQVFDQTTSQTLCGGSTCRWGVSISAGHGCGIDYQSYPQLELVVCSSGDGNMQAWLGAANSGVFGFSTIMFHGTATTTTENSCRITTSVTFTNLIACGTFVPPFWGDGSITVIAGC